MRSYDWPNPYVALVLAIASATVFALWALRSDPFDVLVASAIAATFALLLGAGAR